MAIGRNTLCPCGSGKKHKGCCLGGLRSANVSDLTQRRLQDVEARLLERLTRHAEHVFGASSLDEAWHEFNCWGELMDFDLNDPIMKVFVPYFIYSWRIDPAETNCNLSLADITVAESFLAIYRSKLSADEIFILESNNRPTFSFYLITEVRAGQGFSLRNILNDTECEVSNYIPFLENRTGAIIFAALGSKENMRRLVGISPYLVPPTSLYFLRAVRKSLQRNWKTKYLTDIQISEDDAVLRDIYLSLIKPVTQNRVPVMNNTDGDPIAPQILHYEIEDPHHAFERIKSLALGRVSDEALLLDAKFKDGRVTEVDIPWYKPNKSKRHSPMNTVLGRIKIAGNKMSVEVNSDKRAARVKKHIFSALGDSAQFKVKVIESIDSYLEKSRRRSSIPSSATSVDQLPPETLETVTQMARSHWENWLDDKIPALNNKTPKQSAKTSAGRELLEALLTEYAENSTRSHDLTSKLFQPNIPKLRAQLGLPV